jgi:hypothetical protein
LLWCLILKLVREVVNRRDFLPFHLGQPPSSQTSRHDFEKRPGHDNLQDDVPMTLLDVVFTELNVDDYRAFEFTFF